MSSNLANPFKGLQSYDHADREKLFGRDRDLVLMKDRIFSARTTLLFAGSGVGKTSFLNAKIIPELETLYCTFYHNRWAGPSEPLDAVKSTLAEKLEIAKKDCTLLDILQQFNEALAPLPTQSLSDGDGIAPHAQCLMIFDQFEEIFQYHAYEDYFKRFLNELCDVIKKTEYRVHIVFSMREEFLGELSVFDNIIPDLFNNYYRLKYPDTREAKQIIEGTCNIAHTKVDKENLTQLIRDLSKIDKGAAGAAERSTRADKASDHVIERDFIIPPYLQIACHRQWQNQADKALEGANGSFVFLEDYKPDQAQKMLRDFCQEKLSTLSFMEQNVAAQSFDFLVTKQGAKMAYEFTSLAEHMRIRFFKGNLKRALDKLSDFETRILRKSHGPDGSLWFELYHDIYGKILDTWRHSFRRRKRRAAITAGFGTLVLLFILIPITLHWIVYPYTYKKLLRDVQLEKPEDYVKASAAYETLSRTYGYQSSANSLWAQAWGRRARYAESHNKRDEAIISWLKALSFEPDGADAERWRLKVGNLTGNSYQFLRANLHHENSITDIVFSNDGRVIVTKTDDQKLWVWDGSTGEQIGKYSDFPLTQSAAPEQVGNGPFAMATPPDKGKEKSREDGTLSPSQKGKAKENGSYESPGYKVLATALHPEFGWLIAVISENDERLLHSRFRRNNGKRAEYFTLKVSVLSKGDELRNSSVLMDASIMGYSLNYGVSLSSDGKYMATKGGGQYPHVLKLVDRKFVPATEFKTTGMIKQAVFSSDSRSLALINDKDQLFIWDVGSEKLRFQPIHVPQLKAVNFSPDGNSFVSYATLQDLPLIQVWNTATGKPIGMPINKKLEGSRYSQIALGSDGKVILLNTVEASLRFADVQSGELQDRFKVIAKESDQSLRFSPTGKMGLVFRGKEAQLFRIEREQVHGATLKASDPIAKTVLSEDGREIVTMSEPIFPPKASSASLEMKNNRVVQAWDAEMKVPIGNPINKVIALSEDGKYLAKQEQSKGPIQILNVRNGTEVMHFNYPKPENDYDSDTLFDILFSRNDGKFFVTYSSKGESADYLMYRYLAQGGNGDSSALDTYSPKSGAMYLWAQDKTSDPIFPSESLKAFQRYAAIFSHDGKHFAFSGDQNKGVTVWELFTRQPVHLSNNLPYVGTLSFNNHGQLIAGGAKIVRVWDLNSLKPLYNDIETGTQCNAVALSPDGKMALTGEVNGTESLWKFANNGIGARVGAELKHGDPIWSVNFSDDGKTGVIMVGDWLHIININNNEHEASYFLGENWLHQCQSMDGTSDHYRCVFQLQDKELKVVDIQSSQIMDSTAIKGVPQELLEQWQRQLALKINRVGQIVPEGVGGEISSSGNQP